MKYWSRIAANLLLLSLAAATVAESAGARLVELLSATDSYAASFSQTVYGSRGEVLERASGQVRLQGRQFRWEVMEPYPQIVVADEEYLRVYDPDLAQVTLRPVAEALTDTPIWLLTQGREALQQHFHVAHGNAEPKPQREFVLTPVVAESLYAEIRVSFSAAQLASLTIMDHLGQITTIEFTPDPDGAVIQSGAFTLSLPPGTDVIGG